MDMFGLSITEIPSILLYLIPDIVLSIAQFIFSMLLGAVIMESILQRQNYWKP